LVVGDAARSDTLPLVVKIGGSLVETGKLKSTLALIERASRPLVIVPGGGAFVDKVRDLQLAVRFDDHAAHRLAMLGMHQMAEVFIPLGARLLITDRVAGIADLIAVGRIPVWVPLPTLDRDDTIPADWSITSDGIAARLAELLGGADVVLVKSVDVAPGATPDDLAANGVVDAVFPSIVARSTLRWHVFGPSDEARFAAEIAATTV
jgi:5-(aminomethyl)-3-furanmethanol phosphate kinase